MKQRHTTAHRAVRAVRLLVIFIPLSVLNSTVLNSTALCGPLVQDPLLASPEADESAEETKLASEAALSDGLVQAFLGDYCLDCHRGAAPEGGLSLANLQLPQARDATDDVAATWEKVVRRLATRQMPPATVDRPDEAQYEQVLAALIDRLDNHAVTSPRPGRTETFRRLTRVEYRNAVRDLLGVDVDTSTMLPADQSSHGFDNVTVTGLSPTYLNRLITAAEKISRLAVGSVSLAPEAETFRVRGDVTQDGHRVDGLPLGTRGGLAVEWNFPRDGQYELQIRLMRDRNDELEGLKGTHQLDVLLDRRRVETFRIERPKQGDDRQVDANLVVRFAATAGPHDIGVTFADRGSSLLESDRQPLNVHYNYYRHPRLGPAVYQVSITGPLGVSSTGDSPSRRKIFTCQPTDNQPTDNQPTDRLSEDACAEHILRRLLKLAYRRAIDEEDLRTPMEMFRQARDDHGFDAGIQNGLASILASPHFFFRIERAPASQRDDDKSQSRSESNASGPPLTDRNYRVSDVDLASRISFFLWSSIPDEELLDAALAGALSEPATLERQVRRMLADPRSRALVDNFADQWLYLRNLEDVNPDARLFPDFDHNLRAAFRQETELLFEEVLREDHSVLRLIDADYTYLNERLARHYRLPHVHGSHFRRVNVSPDDHRGGILRHGSILSVTSYATRTSPVLRGTWILENILGTPPPLPPPNIPALEDNTVDASLPVRERLAVHRANAACAVCHDLIDPPGFALENYDAIGGWRELELEQPLDASGGLPDGTQFVGVAGLEQALLRRPELFVQTMAEKLLTYALGRGLEHYDGPAIREIVRGAETEEFRFSSLVLGIVRGTPFQFRERRQLDTTLQP